MLQVGDKIYMFYHSQKLAADLRITQGYRTTGVDLVTMDENGDLTSSMTNEGVSQVGSFNPYDALLHGQMELQRLLDLRKMMEEIIVFFLPLTKVIMLD